MIPCLKSLLRSATRRLVSSTPLLMALLLHLAALALLGGYVIYERAVQPVTTVPTAVLPDDDASTVQLSPVTPEDEREKGPTEPDSGDRNPQPQDIVPEKIFQKAVIETDGPGGPPIFQTAGNLQSMLTPNLNAEWRKTTPLPEARDATPRPVPLSATRLEALRQRLGDKPYHFQTGSLTTVRARFTCYVARYQGGDWDHNSKLSPDGQRIAFGAIPNLMTQLRRWNKNLEVNIEATPLDLAGQELFTADPPVAFVYMTGHSDFRLSDAEVANLQKYILAGGVIWGDSALPGRNSRFDIAFRREMRRILPDPGQELGPLDPSHPLFTQQGSLLKDAPAGLNYYQEPVEAAFVDGKIGVIYTLNAYGNLWQVALDERNRILEVFDEGTERQPNATYTSSRLWGRRQTYYRNVAPDSVRAAYQLGMHIVVHLLRQYQDDMSRMRCMR